MRSAIVGPISLTVAAGTCVAISGASGAGKSLFLRMIADLDPNEGSVLLGDLRRDAMAAPLWRRQVIHVAAEPGWWSGRVDAHVPPGAGATAGDMCRHLGLAADCLSREIATLSTGERQRLALIRALVRKPKALLLDEPTAALDASSIGCVEALLQTALSEGLALVLVTHDAAQARRLDAISYVMRAGRLQRGTA